MLSLIIAESAIELVPKNLQRHNSVMASANRFNKKPSEILLDISWHFAAMKGLENELKRGRPDLVHFSLLEACSIPLYFENRMNVFVHTINDKVIFVGKNVRLPKSYHRFSGLIEKLFLTGKIEEDDKKLLEIKDMKFSELIKKINPKQTIGLSRNGEKNSYYNLSQKIDDDTCLVIGGFAKSHFSDEIIRYCDRLVSIDKISLESHVVIARILYEYEKRIIM